MDLSIDPTNPEPGGSTTLTVTVSGQQGVNRFGVPGVKVALTLTEEPGGDASINPATVTTDASGTATSQMRLSTKRGRHIVGPAPVPWLPLSLSIPPSPGATSQPALTTRASSIHPGPAGGRF